ESGIVHAGWCPLGRKAEDGPIPARYRLRETDSEDYSVRTRRNVRDSDATLILNVGVLDGGSRTTLEACEAVGREVRTVQLDDESPFLDVTATRSWLASARPRILNVAGPRESKRAGVYALALEYLRRLSGANVVAEGP